MQNIIRNPSQSRTYVAICISTNHERRYLKKFTLPEKEENTYNHAQWYFLNRLDFTAALDSLLTIEEYKNILPVAQGI